LEEREGVAEWFVDRDRWIESRRTFKLKEERFDERDRHAEMKEVAETNGDAGKAENDRDGIDYEQVRVIEGNGVDVAVEDQNCTWTFSVLKGKLADLLRGQLKFLNPLHGNPSVADEIFDFPVDWNYLTKEFVEKKLIPLIDTKISAFLGESDSDLVDYILETALPSGIMTNAESDLSVQLSSSDANNKNPKMILEEISSTFGDTEEEREVAADLLLSIWKAVIWDVEKRKVVIGRNIDGMDVSLEDLEINEVI
jgi:hypothetical protein